MREAACARVSGSPPAVFVVGPQRDALGAALGLTSGRHPAGQFPVAAGVVELLVTLAEEQAVLCLVRRCAMDRPAVSRAPLRAATAAPCCSMRRMQVGERSGGKGRQPSEGGASIGLLRERAGPGRPLHGGLAGQGRRFSMDAARSGARSRPVPRPRGDLVSPRVSQAATRTVDLRIGRRQVQPVFQASRAPRELSPTLTFPLGRRLDAGRLGFPAARLALSRCDRECGVCRLYPPSGRISSREVLVSESPPVPMPGVQTKSNIPTDSCSRHGAHAR